MLTKSGRPMEGGGAWNNATAEILPSSRTVVIVTMKAQCQWDAYPVENIDRWWVLRTDLPAAPAISSNGRNYSWTASLSSSSPLDATFCLDELYTPPTDIPTRPVFDPSPTTAAVDAWLADIEMPSGTTATRKARKVFYTAWYQYWLNTEPAWGNFVRPFVCGSISYYPRGQWLWDTGFHVFGLLGGGPLGLQKALDQLSNFVAGGKRLGHTPRAIGYHVYQTETQPLGILTWAALAVYNRTRDANFLRDCYDSFKMNNDWYLHERTPLPSNVTGLAIWGGQDTGWDTSPRWDCPSPSPVCTGHGPVCASEAVDLNAWLRIDSLMLAEMATILGLPEAARHWHEQALAIARAMNNFLWNEADGVFLDRNASTGPVRVATPATFFALLSGVATAKQADAMVSAMFRPNRLAAAYQLPCLGVAEPTFEPNDYWRGPTWININFLSAIGLDCYGYKAHARAVLNSSAQLVLGGPYPFEYYNPLNGTGQGAEHFMWSGALYLIIAKELHSGRPSDVSLILRHVVPCKSDDEEQSMKDRPQTKPRPSDCLGEFAPCASTGECTLFNCTGPGPHCSAGQYRCPISNACVNGASGYLHCPGLAGTHLDHTLDTETRVSLLINATSLTEQILQLTNAAPAIEHAGIPGYNWLSDDEHGVRGWQSTYFPNGPGLGASFDKELLYSVGQVVGLEARAKHNFLTHTHSKQFFRPGVGILSGRVYGPQINGEAITVYGPNMNLVRDPRSGLSFPEAPSLFPLNAAKFSEGFPPNLTAPPVPTDGGVRRRCTRRILGCLPP
eukprot:SAG22_NODE_755_length_7442_cov_2.270598_2_plen_788_part_00